MEKYISQDDYEHTQKLEEERVKKLKEGNIDEDEILDCARKDVSSWETYFSENNRRGKDDLNFVIKDQWTAAERSSFVSHFKTPLTFNKMYDIIKKIVGEQRQNRPDLMVRSLTGKASQQDIDLRSDMIRTICYQSQNDLVYQSAFKSALLTGYGAFEVDIDYEDNKSFNRIINYSLISDATQTSFDPAAMKPHKGDGNFCSRRYIFSKDEFYATYPHIDNAVSYSDPSLMLNYDWGTGDTIVVNKYTRKEWYPIRILELSNGQVVTEDEWEELKKQFERRKELANDAIVVKGMILNEIPKVVADRKSQDYKVRQYILTQNHILDYIDFPSKYLPIIFVDGDSYFIEGRQYTKSYIHEGKDAQRFMNFLGSETATEVKNRRREQWMGTKENITGQEQMWRTPELQAGILIARPDPKTGQMPQKLPPAELSQTMLVNFQRANQDLREILGFSETEALQGRDVSGKARRERKLEGSMSTYVYLDNLNQAIEQGGRVVLDLLPIVYGDRERNMVLSKQDGSTQNIILNKRNEEGEVENEIKKGDFDIEISAGPSFAVQKDIALELMAQTMQVYPQAFPLIADLWASQLDLQQMPRIKERFKTLVPPQILAQEEGKEPPPPQPDPQSQMMQAELQLKQQQLADRAQELQIRREKHELEKVELMLEAQKLKQEGIDQHLDRQLERKKVNIDAASKLASIIKDLQQ